MPHGRDLLVCNAGGSGITAMAIARLQLAGEQMVQNIEVMGKLATSRHWPEALVIQQGFAQASYARLARGMTCHLGWRA